MMEDLTRFDRPIHATPQRAHLLSRLVLLVSLLASLACTGSQFAASPTLQKLTESGGKAIDGLFEGATGSGDKNLPPLAETPTVFTVPTGWHVVEADSEQLVYRLVHPQHDDASMVISHERLERGSDAVSAELKALHSDVLARMPSDLEQLSQKTASPTGRSWVHTTLQGRPSPDSATLHVSGYSVAVASDAYHVFAAFRPEVVSTLSPDVEALAKSLRSSDPPATP